MKKHLPTIILVIIFLIGLSILLYPSISDSINSRNQSRAIASYSSTVSGMATTDYSDVIAAATAYNESLLKRPHRFFPTEAEQEEYNSLLNIMGNGIMGYLEIDVIDVRLAIYHGIDDEVLQVGIGHIDGSSLPIGGEGTHTIISGHRGLPSAKLLSSLDKVAIGDTFRLVVLNEVLTYEVDQILIVEPDDTSALSIIKGEDYATLVTCTPYGVNSHRLLVRGHRIETDGSAASNVRVTADAQVIDSLVVAIAIAVPILVILLIVVLVKYGKRGGRS